MKEKLITKETLAKVRADLVDEEISAEELDAECWKAAEYLEFHFSQHAANSYAQAIDKLMKDGIEKDAAYIIVMQAILEHAGINTNELGQDRPIN